MREAAKQDGRTVLYVSHNMNTIRTLCDRCIVLDKGKVLFDGEVDRAIELYLCSKNNDDVRIDFTKRTLPNWLKNPKIKLLFFEFCNKVNNIFEYNENLIIRIIWANLQSIKDVSLRFEIYNRFEEPVSVFCVFDLLDCEKNTETELVVDIDISKFVAAEYQIKITFFEKDQFGNNIDVGFGRDIYFTKTSNTCTFPINWSPSRWGYIVQPTPKVLMKKTIKIDILEGNCYAI